MRNQHDNKYIIKSRLRIEGKKVNQNATTCNKNEIKQERRQEDKTSKGRAVASMAALWVMLQTIAKEPEMCGTGLHIGLCSAYVNARI